MQPPQGIEGSRTLVTMIRTWCLAVGPQSLKLPSEIESLHDIFRTREELAPAIGAKKSAEKMMSSSKFRGNVRESNPFLLCPKQGSCHWTNAPQGSSQAKSNHSILHTREEPVPAMRAKQSTERIELSFTVPKTVVLIHYTTRTEPHRLMS